MYTCIERYTSVSKLLVNTFLFFNTLITIVIVHVCDYTFINVYVHQYTPSRYCYLIWSQQYLWACSTVECNSCSIYVCSLKEQNFREKENEALPNQMVLLREAVLPLWKLRQNYSFPSPLFLPQISDRSYFLCPAILQADGSHSDKLAYSQKKKRYHLVWVLQASKIKVHSKGQPDRNT